MKVRTRSGLFLFALTCFTNLSLTAAVSGALGSTNAPASDPQSSGDFLALFLRLVGAFILVASILICGALYFRKSRFFSLYQGGAAQLKILESKSIGYRNNLLVVGYCQHRFLLAVSTTGASLLCPLPDASPGESTPVKGPSFAEQLQAQQDRKA